MLPLIRREIVEKNRWMGDDEFVDGIAASQSCPGPVAVNLSVYAGYHLDGWSGLTVAVLGTVLPSFLIILVIAVSFSQWAELSIVKRAFHGLRPAVTALIVVPVIQISRSSNLKWHHYWLPLAAVILIGGFHVSPIYLILFTLLLAWIKYLAKQPKEPQGES